MPLMCSFFLLSLKHAAIHSVFMFTNVCVPSASHLPLVYFCYFMFTNGTESLQFLLIGGGRGCCTGHVYMHVRVYLFVINTFNMYYSVFLIFQVFFKILNIQKIKISLVFDDVILVDFSRL